jgi:transcriptional regulator with XRE-family HTH domain
MYDKQKALDFLPIGQAVKSAREGQNLTREQVAETLELAPRYIMSIENKGQHPSLRVFYRLVTMFGISVDPFFFPDMPVERSSRRRQVDRLIDKLDDKDLMILESTARGIIKARSAGEE